MCYIDDGGGKTVTDGTLLIVVNIVMNTIQVLVLAWIAAKYRQNGYKS